MHGYFCLNHTGSILNGQRVVIHIRGPVAGTLANSSLLDGMFALCYDAQAEFTGFLERP
jgi:hypothetical protein